MLDRKQYKKELNDKFNAHCVASGICHVNHSDKYWELYEEMVEAPLNAFIDAELEDWDSSDERKEFLAKQAKNRRAMLYA